MRNLLRLAAAALEHVVREAQGLVRQGRGEHRGITDGEDGVERLRAGVIQDLLGGFLGSLEAQR